MSLKIRPMRKGEEAAVAALLVSFALPALAQEEMKRGASAQAYEHASDQAIFNRVSDWFATTGKSEEEKAAILAERKAKRAAKRAEKEAKKARKEAEKKAKKAQEGLENAGRKAREKTGKAGRDAEGFMKRQGQGRNK